MLPKKIRKWSALQIAVSALVSSTIIGTAHLASGGAGGSSAIMLSQGPCSFSVQLQKSVAVRKRYLVKLGALTGGPELGGVASNGTTIEEMYGDIQQASYNPDAAPVEDDRWGFGSTAARESAALDPLSSDCMTCHDGAGAVSVGVDWRNNPSGLRALRKPHGTDHPVGMEYESYVASRGGDYKPISKLNTKMVLVDGRVGCLTCHDPMNAERRHLVMSDRGSALCLTCHGK